MYIVDKKEKIKINDVDRFEGFELFGRELDGISKLLLLIIAGLIAALIYMQFFKSDESSSSVSEPEPLDNSSMRSPSTFSEPMTTALALQPSAPSPRRSAPSSYRSQSKRRSANKK